jgi:5-methylcytosine-specific restriction endonuclease McrA
MIENDVDYWALRPCVRQPIADLFRCAWLLDRAVSAHLAGDREQAARLFGAADMNSVREWTESLWGSAKKWPEQKHYKRLRAVDGLPEQNATLKDRMPTPAQRRTLVDRDGFNCRYCGLPVIPKCVRDRVAKDYPDKVSWGGSNAAQHAGFQALWLQFDHIVPHSFGGTNELENIVISCAGCNYCKEGYRIEHLGVEHPLQRPVLKTSWDGLVRYVGGIEQCRL